MKKLTIITILLSLSLFSWTNLPPASKKLKKILGQNWAFVPAGLAKMGETTQNVEDFFILKTEISNLDYRTFVESLKDKKPLKYKSALPDTNVWSNQLSFNQSYVNQYFRYPGFNQYPVVGVSHQNALLYCKWLEENINAQMNDTEKVVVKLPTEMEWTRAARGDNQKALYPWESSALQDKKGRSLANYKNKEKYEAKSMIIITAGVKSYTPNEFGIYQMSGNLAEMIDVPKKVKGGSWNMPANSLKIDESEMVEYPAINVGFRPVLMVVSK